MKHSKFQIVTATAIIVLSLFSLTLIQSCKKDPCSGVTCLNGGTCNGGSCTCPTGYSGQHCETKNQTTITYQNNTPTAISITVNGTTSIINVGSSISYNGTYGDQLSVTAFTYGTSSTGTQIGTKMPTWSLTTTFPSTGTKAVPLDVDGQAFFVEIQNNSSKPITKVYVNYNTTAQSLDNITIPNDGNVYKTGYYLAATNSNIRAEAADGTYWQWNTLNLTGANNQIRVVVAN